MIRVVQPLGRRNDALTHAHLLGNVCGQKQAQQQRFSDLDCFCMLESVLLKPMHQCLDWVVVFSSKVCFIFLRFINMTIAQNSTSILDVTWAHFLITSAGCDRCFKSNLLLSTEN